MYSAACITSLMIVWTLRSVGLGSWPPLLGLRLGLRLLDVSFSRFWQLARVEALSENTLLSSRVYRYVMRLSALRLPSLMFGGAYLNNSCGALRVVCWMDWNELYLGVPFVLTLELEGRNPFPQLLGLEVCVGVGPSKITIIVSNLPIGLSQCKPICVSL